MRRIRIYKKKKRKINIERLHLEELRVTHFFSLYNIVENNFKMKQFLLLAFIWFFILGNTEK